VLKNTGEEGKQRAERCLSIPSSVRYRQPRFIKNRREGAKPVRTYAIYNQKKKPRKEKRRKHNGE